MGNITTIIEGSIKTSKSGDFAERGGPKQWEFIDGWDESTFKNFIELIDEQQIF
ncbi:hypothetical protein [Chryseobacterium limigenitum]|uniref:Uncharacterized protein n=1 Tax=Chryseobacterium limigenitum TaxID=1612149 RepID=A0A1K2ITP1_9FLAO|nr:hypothetical protein [Chryseobacterium limigenitum]SFZ95091.1 hypothetical protein SAMN05216324_108138 [Chryseobacterium limigenitum]